MLRWIAVFLALNVGGILALIAAGRAGDSEVPGAVKEDPPHIVKWSSVGSAHMGHTVEQVRNVYGSPEESQTLKLPIGTRYANSAVERESYRVRGGRLVVTYVDGVARAFQTDSRRYRTADGIGVGATISRGPCRRNTYGSCEYKWRSFQFDECGNSWVDASDSLEVVIGMNGNLFEHPKARIAWLEFGDLQVVLYCF